MFAIVETLDILNTLTTKQGDLKMMKQHTRHFQIAAQAVAMGNKEYAIRYLEGMIRSATSSKAEKEIKAELVKYL